MAIARASASLLLLLAGAPSSQAATQFTPPFQAGTGGTATCAAVNTRDVPSQIRIRARGPTGFVLGDTGDVTAGALEVVTLDFATTEVVYCQIDSKGGKDGALPNGWSYDTFHNPTK